MYISFLLPYNIRHTKAPFLWVFYKQLSNFKIDEVFYIGNEDYFVSSKAYHDRDECSEESQYVQGYGIPTDTTLENLHKGIIDKLIFKELEEKFDSYTQIYRYLLTTRYKPLEDELEKIFSTVSKENSIDAILSWCNMPSLQIIADKYNIKVIYNELGPIRLGKVFATEFSYFDFSGVNGNTESLKRYKAASFYHNRLLSHEEILTLLVQEDYLHTLFQKQEPIYEVGIVLQVEDDSNILSFSNALDNDKLINLINNTFSKDEILIRPHPAGHEKYDKYGIIDTSHTSIEFIRKWRRIVTINSSVSLEAILLKKATYILGESPISFLGYNTFDITLEKYAVPDIKEKLNFIVFNYLIPRDFLFKDSYYKFRLDNPSEDDIYNKHLKYLSDLKEILIKPSSSMESMIFSKYIDRQQFIHDRMAKEKEQELQEKEQQLQHYESEIQKLIEYNQELIEIADSMRVKNRIKTIFNIRKKVDNS